MTEVELRKLAVMVYAKRVDIHPLSGYRCNFCGKVWQYSNESHHPECAVPIAASFLRELGELK